MWYDLRLFCWGLVRRPWITTCFLAALAAMIGCGASFLDTWRRSESLLFGFPDAARIVWVGEQSAHCDSLSLSLPDAIDWVRISVSYEAAGICKAASVHTNIGGADERLDALYASSGFFTTLAVPPKIGHCFNRDDDERSANPAVILTSALYQKLSQIDPEILKNGVDLEGVHYSVSGVMPEGFRFPQRADLWISLGAVREDYSDRTYHAGFWGVAKLRSGVSPQKAMEELNQLSAQLQHNRWETPDQRFRLDSLKTHYAGDLRRALAYLFGAADLLLILVFASGVSRLQSLVRRPERPAGRVLLRLCARRRIQLRGVAIAAAIVTAGPCAYALSRRLLLGVTGLETIRPHRDGFDWWLLLSVAGLAIAPALLRAVWIANPRNWRSEFPGPRTWFRVKWRGAEWEHYIKVFYLALWSALIIWASSLALSYWQESTRELGYTPDRLSSLRVDLDSSKVDDPTSISVYSSLLSAVRRLPGILSASICSRVPGEGTDLWDSAFAAPNLHSREPPHMELSSIGPDYFRTLGIRVLRGREFAADDARSYQPGQKDHAADWVEGLSKIIIDEKIAKVAWPGDSAVGNKLRLPWGKYSLDLEIVGVVAHVSLDRRGASELPQAYVPYGEAPKRGAALIYRGEVPMARVIEQVRSELKRLDVAGIVYDLTSIDQTPGNTLRLERLTAAVLCALAIASWTFVGLGIFPSWPSRSGPAGSDAMTGAEMPRPSGRRPKNVLATIEGCAIGAALFAVVNLRYTLVFFGLNDAELLFIAVGMSCVAVLLLLPAFGRTGTAHRPASGD